MRAKWLVWVRRIHRYQGIFFSPFLLLFCVTGIWQTVTIDRNKGAVASAPLIQKLSDVHIDQYYPISGSKKVSTWWAKAFTVVMSCGLILSILTGIILGFIMERNKTLIALLLILGIVVPVIILALAHW